jgi:galactose mutarotase-like enzyme
MVRLELTNQKVKVDAGELVSYTVDGHEFIHQKGSPGWGSADTEMFPIIGPVNEADFFVQTQRGNAVQDQHGHFRLLPYNLVKSTETSAIFQKEYQANTWVPNKKYPENSNKSELSWPYSFSVEKSFELTSSGLGINFTITGESGMPFMLGYHPAFKLDSKHPTIKTKSREITLNEVLAVGSRALEVANHNEITLKDQKEITIKTEGFGHFMCWTEVRNMVCIEPITFYPYAVEQHNLHEGFQQLSNKEVFKIALHPKL